MYLNYFNLAKEPFKITPDPSFLYLSPGHKEALASIRYGVEQRKGFILISGAVGVGKTTVLMAYLEKVDKKILRTVYVFNANISYHSLLRCIFRELGTVPESDETCEMVNQLHRVLTDEYKQGRNVLLLIDEAQNMPVDTLENLRMLSNLETATEKLIQIVFSGQPEFEKTLNLEILQQLKQRIVVRAVISPLTGEEGRMYVHHRLKKAADTESSIFTSFALREIVRIAKGIPRVINVLCDNSLITAFQYGRKKVNTSVVKEISREFGMQKSGYLRWRIHISAALLMATGLYCIKDRVPLLTAKPALSLQTEMRHRIPAQRNSKGGAGTTNENETVYLVVEKGDTLAKLIRKVYGRVDSNLITSVKSANPIIENEHLIREGSSIAFPLKKHN